ncbi:MAG: WG repeat-containing protein [Bacteroidales bacterium]|nr:WG repeat-containing protein [Bacteroidales bacterium]
MKLAIILLFLFFSNFNYAQTGRIEIKNDKYGIIDTRTKKLIADYIYDDVEILQGLGYLVMQNEKMGLLDKTGKKILNCVYEDIYQILGNTNYVITENSMGKLAVYSIKEQKNVLSGFVADLYNPVYGPYNELTGNITKTIVIIDKNGKKSLLELPLKYLLPLEYDKIVPCISKPGRLLLKKSNKFRIYNVVEKRFISPEFELQPGDENFLINNNTCMLNGKDYFPVKIAGKWGMMNISAKFKLPPKYSDLRMSHLADRNKAFTALNYQNNWYIYNNGKMKVFAVDYFLGFWYNYAVIIKNEKVLFYNTLGNKFLEIKLKNPNDYSVKAFVKNGKYGLVNNKSRLLLDFLYQDIQVFDNLVFAKKNNKYALHSVTGQALTTYKYDELRPGWAKDKVLIFKQYGKYGLMDYSGNEILKPKFTYISAFKNGVAEVKIYKTAYTIDTKGNIIE